ncbi:hypothetical protein YC2023_051680 [Brassica napus]
MTSLSQGLKKADQQIILDDLNKHGPGFTWPSVSGAMPQVQGCVNEGEAVGRGAATSGFNNFIALTEAAKDLKDGTKLIYQIDAGGIQGHCWKKEGEAGKKCVEQKWKLFIANKNNSTTNFILRKNRVCFFNNKMLIRFQQS